MADHVLERQTYAAGARVFSQGQQGDRAYIVQDGEVEIYRGPEGSETVLGRLGKGAIFGEMALLDDAPRMASARAVSATTVIIVNRSLFQEKLRKTDPFIRGLLNILAASVRDAHAS